MNFIEIGLMLSTLFVTLVAGVVLTFAIVVMPGIRSLSDYDFLRAFKVMDRVIQKNHPVFMLVWVGSILILLATALLGLFLLESYPRYLLLGICILYIFGVMLPTVRINVPLNNELQQLDLNSKSDTELRDFRYKFEPIWNRWNVIRTIVAIGAAVLLFFGVMV